MNGTPLQLAKREWQVILTSRPVQIGVLAVGLVAGLAGPFGTAEQIALIPRLLYWLGIVAMTYVTGSTLTAAFRQVFSQMGAPRLLAAALSAIPAGLVIAGEVVVVNALLFALPIWDLPYLMAMAGNGIAIALIVTLAGTYLAGTSSEDAPALPALLDRLPIDKRGPLLSLSVNDHYVAVTTTRGRDLLLMRLSDAIRETAPTRGLQVHRSHWVALEAVASAKRVEGRLVLTLSNGQDIPVSRSHLAAVKEAGLLPG